jgi:hypothetical protein
MPKVQKNQVGLEIYGTQQILAFADDVNLLGKNMNNIKKNTDALLDVSNAAGIEVDTEET